MHRILRFKGSKTFFNSRIRIKTARRLYAEVISPWLFVYSGFGFSIANSNDFKPFANFDCDIVIQSKLSHYKYCPETKMCH